MSEEKTVTITESAYAGLLADSETLAALESGGVDNWEWYHESLQQAGLLPGEDD